MQRAIGIDLGTTKSVVAALRQGEPQAILNRGQSPLTPSALSLGSAGEVLVGQAALERLPQDPWQTVLSFKPLLGLGRTLAFNGLEYTPTELAALLLAHLRDDAEAALGEPVGRAVLTVPASFGLAQVAALRQAAGLAGLFVWRVLRDPTAAALAHSISQPPAEAQTLLVYDMGGGCLDVGVLRLFRGALTVLGLAGESWLGGDDLTQSIVAHLLRRIQEERGAHLDETLPARHELRQALRQIAEQVKLALSTVDYARLWVPADALESLVPIDEVLTRAQFEEMIRPRLEEALAVVERAVLAAGLPLRGIDGVLPMGGCSQVPLLQTLLAQRLPQAHVVAGLNPLLGVAMGAAALTGMLSEVTCPTCRLAHPLEAQACRRCGTPLAGQARLACPRCFLPNDPARETCWKCERSLRSARLPRRVRARRPQTCPRCQSSVAGERAVCPACHAPLGERAPAGLRCGHCGQVQEAGAASCARCGELVAPFVGQVSTRALGAALADGRMDVILPAGLGLPTQKPARRELRTSEQGQRTLELPLCEGERPWARENQPAGTLRLGLPEGLPAGSTVRVDFGFDADGTVTVTATLADGSDVDAWAEY